MNWPIKIFVKVMRKLLSSCKIKHLQCIWSAILQVFLKKRWSFCWNYVIISIYLKIWVEIPLFSCTGWILEERSSPCADWRPWAHTAFATRSSRVRRKKTTFRAKRKTSRFIDFLYFFHKLFEIGVQKTSKGRGFLCLKS